MFSQLIASLAVFALFNRDNDFGVDGAAFFASSSTSASTRGVLENAQSCCDYQSNPLFQEYAGLSKRRKNENGILRKSRATTRRYQSSNPNDHETPEERQRRMEMVKQLQKSFYKDETDGIIMKQKKANNVEVEDDGTMTDCMRFLDNVPLWRVQWTELPGYQNVLNVHVPHYTNMFMKIFNGRPKDMWYFGQLYLPGGSENMNNPDYDLCVPSSKAVHTGTLMKVSDYQQLDDGRLVLLVQAVGKFKVLNVTQKLPYTVVNVEVVTDGELVKNQYQIGTELVEQSVFTVEEKAKLWNAACSVAILEAQYWEQYEFRNVLVQDCLAGKGNIIAASPLVNYDKSFQKDISLEHQKQFDATANMKDELDLCSDDVQKSELQQIENNAMIDSVDSNSNKALLELERDVWIALDGLIQSLIIVNPMPKQNIPVPTQMLGLLPTTNIDWPSNFRLTKYVDILKLNNAQVGTTSKSPFVIVDKEEENSADLSPLPLRYNQLRRVQRFSFVIWYFLDNQLAGSSTQTKQKVLEMDTISERLQAAKNALNTMNDSIQLMIRKDSFQ